MLIVVLAIFGNYISPKNRLVTIAFADRSDWSIWSEIRWSVSRGTGGQFKPKRGGQFQRNLHIASYYPDFNKEATIGRDRYPTMADYLVVMGWTKDKLSNVNPLKAIIYSILLEVLRLAGIKDKITDRSFSSAGLDRSLKSESVERYQRLRIFMEKTCRDFINGKDISVDVTSFLKNELLPFFKYPVSPAICIFLTASSTITMNPSKPAPNIYSATYSNETVDIFFDTIHSVKGETHTGTLYLETFTKTHDIPKLLPLLSGRQNRTKTYIDANKGRMRQGFVAMSRPTDLIVLAVNKQRIDLTVDWEKLGYSIIFC